MRQTGGNVRFRGGRFTENKECRKHPVSVISRVISFGKTITFDERIKTSSIYFKEL